MRRGARTVVDGLVLSRVRYCISVYGGRTSKNDANFATRVITFLRKYDHISHAREDLGLLSPPQMYEVWTLTVAHKAITHGKSVNISPLITTFRDSYQQSERNILARVGF